MRGPWYPAVLDLHRYFLVARAAVNVDDSGGTAIDPVCGLLDLCLKTWKVKGGVRNFALLSGPPSLWGGELAFRPS